MKEETIQAVCYLVGVTLAFGFGAFLILSFRSCSIKESQIDCFEKTQRTECYSN